MQSINKSNKNVFKLGSLIEYYPKNNNLPPISGSVYPNLQLFTCNDFLNRVIPQLFFDLNQFITEDKVNKFKNFIVPTHVVATLHFFTSWIKMINFCICLFTVWTLFFSSNKHVFVLKAARGTLYLSCIISSRQPGWQTNNVAFSFQAFPYNFLCKGFVFKLL